MIYCIIYLLKGVVNLFTVGANIMILLSMDVLDLTFSHIVNFLAVAIVLWFIVKNFLEMRKAAKEQIVREQSWDETAKIVKEKEKEWDSGLAGVMEERKQIVERYDKRLDELGDKIDSNYTDTEAKIQGLRSDMVILTESMRAVLDGLHQLNCNGKVTEASEKLDAYLIGLVGRG